MSFDLPLNTNTTSAAERNTVLRQTYMLLAVSLIPTILGAAIGVYTGLAQMMRFSPFISMAIFFAGAFGLMYMVQKNSHSSAGIGWLMAFTFFMGLMLSSLISRVLGYSNGPSLIMTAFGGPAALAADLTAAGLTPSNSEANRKLKERAVRIDGAVVEDVQRVFAPGFEGVLAVGKRTFSRVRLVAG